jgi:phenylacetate-CoA ligase
MPTNLEFLASLVRESGQRLPALRVIQAIGETLSPVARSLIEDSFGAPVRNLYSNTEAGYVASPCPAGHGLHVHSENVLAEVLDADNRPCAPGQTGRLVLTTLHNFLTPFVRYDIVDEVTLAPGPCPCGRGLPLWTHVVGRHYPTLHLTDGRRKSSAVNHMVARVIPDRTWSPDHAARLRKAIQAEMEAPVQVDIEEKAYIERPRGGKLNLIVVEIKA